MASTANPAAALERLMPRGLFSRRTWLWVAYTGTLFFVFLAITFPHDLVARRAAQRLAEETGWRLHFDDAWLVPWSGYRLSGVRLTSDGDDPWLDSRRLGLRPSLASLFGGKLSAASFHGDAYGGRFSGRLSLGGSRRLELSWNALELLRYRRLTALVEGEWGGTLSGDLELALGETLRDLEGRGRLTLVNGSLTAGSASGFTIPDITATRGDGEFDVKAGRVEIRSMKLTGAEVDADLRGQIYLREPLAESVINATLSVKPVPGSPPGLEALLQMWNKGQPAAGGAYTLTLYGMLRQIRVR